MIQAKLADGRTLEFPDGTEQDIVDRAVRVEMGLQPAGGTDPVSALGKGPEPPTLYIGPEPPPVEPQRPFGERVLEEIPQVGGGIVGGVATAPLAVKAGIAGTAMGGPIVGAGAALGVTALGVAFGAGTGEAYKQIGQQLSGSLDAPKTSMEAAKRVGKAGATEGAWDLVGGLAMKGVGKIIAPLKKKVLDEGIDAIDLFKDKLKPIVLLPAEATESRVLDLLQNVSESSIIGGASIQEFKTGRVKFFDDFADSLIDEFGKRTDPTDLGNLFVTSISNSRAVHSKAAKILYNSVKAGRTKTQISSLKNFAKPLQKRAMKLEGIEAKNAGDDLMDAVMSLPDQLSYKEATELRSRLISRINEFSILNKKAPAIGKAKKLVGLLDKAIGKSLGEIGVPTPTPKVGKEKVVTTASDFGVPKSTVKGEYGEGFRTAIYDWQKKNIGEKVKFPLSIKSMGITVQGPEGPEVGEFMHGIFDGQNKLVGEFSLKKREDIGLISNFYIYYQKQGVATDIFPSIDDIAKKEGCKKLELTIDPGWNESYLKTLKKLYEKAGFKEKSWDEFGLVMEKSIAKAGKKWTGWDEELARQELQKTTKRKFDVNRRTMDELPELVAEFEAGERKFYRGTIPGAKGKEPIRKDFYPQAKRDPKAKRRALWIAKDKKSTIHYGSQTEEIIAKPEAKILYEGTEEFGRIMGITDYNPQVALSDQFANIPKGDVKEFKRTGGILPLKDIQNMVTKAKKKGYDALSFAYDDEIGTVIFNEKVFIRHAEKVSQVPSTGPTPLEAWRTANRFYKDGQKKFNSTLLRRLVKLADETGTGAEMIGSAIFKPQHVTSVRKVKTALKDDPATWKKMQGFFMQHIMQKSTDASGDIVGRKLINNISGKPGSFGMPMLKEVFTDPQIKALKTFGQAVRLTQEKQAQGAGRVLIQLTQAGAIGAVLTGNLALPAATIIIAPAIMAKMMLNPRMAKLLTIGLTLPAKAPEAGGIMTRLTAAAWRTQMGEERGEENETVK